MRKIAVCLVLGVILFALTTAPAFADEQLYSIAREHQDEVFAGIPNAPWGLVFTARDTVISNIQDMPPGVHQWTAKEINKILFSGIWTSGSTKQQLVQNLAALEQKYSDIPPVYYNPDIVELTEPAHESPVLNAPEPVEPDSFWGEELEQAEQNASFPEKIAAQVVVALPNFLVDVLDLQEPVTLIFQEVPDSLKGTAREPEGFIPAEDLILYTFRDREFQAVAMMYETFRAFLPVVLVIILVGVGVMLYLAAWGNQRVDLRQRLLNIVVALASLVLAPYLWHIVFKINWTVVMMAKTAFAHLGSVSFFELLYRPGTTSLGMALVSLVAAIGVGTLNWQYIMRKLTLGVLIMVFPLVAAISIVKRGVLDIWVREFLSNVFLQSAHAIAFAFFILFTAYASDSPQFFWYAMAFIMGINGIASLVRCLIGAETVGGGLGQVAGAAIGVGSLFALGRMVMVGMGSSVGHKAAQSIGIGTGGGGGNAPPSDGGGGFTAGSGNSASLTTLGPAGWRSASTGSKIKAVGLKSAGIGARAVGKAAQAAGVGIGALGGALVSGVMDGNAGAGLAAGMSLGAIGGDMVQQRIQGFGDTMSGIADEHLATGNNIGTIARQRLGIFDAAQIFDPQSAGAIGRTAFGTPGAVGGYAVGTVAIGLNKLGVGEKAAQRAKSMNTYLGQVQSQLVSSSTILKNITPKLNLAKEKVEYARATFGKGSPQYREAMENYDNLSAQISSYKIQQLQAQNAISSSSIQQEFARLREQQEKGKQLESGMLDDWAWKERGE